jgi:hypothetical protein
MIATMHIMRGHVGVASIGFAWEILDHDAHSCAEGSRAGPKSDRVHPVRDSDKK